MKDNKIFDLTLNKEICTADLRGKYLVASPFVQVNPIFNKSVIYITSCTPDGALGLIINNHVKVDPSMNKSLSKLLLKDTKLEDVKLEIFLGGPVDPDKGFIIHSGEYEKDLFLKCNDEVSISCSLDTLTNILNGSGPNRSLLVMGYTGWTTSQFESEMASNLWIVVESNTDLIFDPYPETKWERALKVAGVNQALFSGQVGNG